MREKREKVVSLRLTAAEHRALGERAELAGKNLSDFVRHLLVEGHWGEPAPLPFRPPQPNTISAAERANVIWFNGDVDGGGTLHIRAS